VGIALFVALIVQLSVSRRKWKRLAVTSGVTNGHANPSKIGAPRYIKMVISCAALYLCVIAFNLGKATEQMNSKHSYSKRGGRARQQRIVIGNDVIGIPKVLILVITLMVVLIAIGTQIGVWFRRKMENSQIRTTSRKGDSIDVIIVGCGPKSVGWFHLMQFLDMQNVCVRAVVEPFYLDEKKCPYPPKSFVDLVIMLDDMGVKCVTHLGQLKQFQQPTLCVIAGRTCDNPEFFREAISRGASHIYLETPGASTLDQLRDMQALATTRAVEVYMGYQRLCAPYISKAMSLSRSVPRSHVFFCHNETYTKEELGAVFDRRPEGMIHSMAAQELAILVTQLGVKVDEIEGLKVNTNCIFSERQTVRTDDENQQRTDYSRVAFKITTKNRRSTSVMADRCGGLGCFAVVKSHTGKEIQRFQSHDDRQIVLLRSEMRENHDLSQSFIIHRDEYLELKRRVIISILGNQTRKRYPGLASIQDAIEVMILADYLKIRIDAVLKVKDS